MATYTVLPGDNLTKIVQHLTNQTGNAAYGYIQALIQLNNLADPDKIYIGQQLTYPDEWTAQPVRPVPIPPKPAPIPVKPPSIFENPVFIGALIIGGLLFLTQRR
jgi:LysM repeat protein